jgi:OmpA-OmpF porin, OOP family
MRRRLPLGLVCAAASWVGAAGAEPVPSLNLRNFDPPTDPRGALYLEPSATPGGGEWNVGAMLSYAHRPIVLEDGDGERIAIPIEHQLSLDYLAALGIGRRIAIGLSLPTVLYQDGDDVEPLIGAPSLPRTAIGDMAFGAKAVLLPADDLGGLGLAALARVTAPTGDRTAYVGEGSVSGELRVLGELKLLALDFLATAGAKVRGSERMYVGQEFGHDLPWGVGLVFHPRAFGLDTTGRWKWTAEVRGRVAITPEVASGPQSPVSYALSARYTPGDVSAIAGVEAPITAAVGSPVIRAVLGFGWAPRFYDEDKDGVSDEEDQCQELEEDRDGVQDADGCPDWDNDDDGVPDDDDRCATEKEDADEFEDDDGCPDPDNDGDKIADAADACPNEAGPDSADPKNRGCSEHDTDGDGVRDGDDRCRAEVEDKDGFKDEDGCPDLDNDTDGAPDEEDACPTTPGTRRSDPKLDGCPTPDKDGDTFDDAEDKCPDQAEDWDGDTDTDGCPDDDSAKPAFQRAKPLVTIVEQGDAASVKWRVVPKFVVQNGSVELDPTTLPSVRALARELNSRPTWVVLVGVQPAGATAEAEQEALSKSFALVYALRASTHRDEVAESVGWGAVQKQPGALVARLGVLVLKPPGAKKTAVAPTPVTPPAPAPPAPAPKPAAPAPKPAVPAPPTPAPPPPAPPGKP